ncbi:MAG: hypothetical protein RIQ79_2096, partial [Verrucomicrobiota bacterium]
MHKGLLASRPSSDLTHPMIAPRLRACLALVFIVGLSLLSARLAAADLYVAPAGTADAPGTLAAPTTLEHALPLIAPGDTIFLRGGTYAFAAQITIARDNSGTGPDARKHLVAYTPPDGAPEHPRLDFSGQPYAAKGNPRGLQLNG